VYFILCAWANGVEGIKHETEKEKVVVINRALHAQIPAAPHQKIQSDPSPIGKG